MKKHLLFTALLFSAASQAQQLDASNEPAVGATQMMYLLDTLTDAYPNITGTGVTWDYSNIVGMNMETRTIEILDASTTAFKVQLLTTSLHRLLSVFLKVLFTKNQLLELF